MNYIRTAFTSTLLVFVIILQPMQSQAQDFTKAIDYLNYINEQYSVIMKEQWEYTKAISKSKGAQTIEKRRSNLLEAIGTAQKNIFKMPAFKGDATFKGFAANHLNINENLVKEDYAKIVDMEEVAEQSYDLMEAYLLAQEKASDKLATAAEAMSEKVKEFASQNNIKLIEEETKLGAKMRNAGEVYAYYNKVYLLFFKSYKQEFFYLEALGKGDLNAAEQNRGAMLSYSKIGLDSLQPLTVFRSDASLSKACRDLMKFYIDEAENQAPIMSDYYLQQDNFKKIKANFDKVKANDRTQEDVDKYNSAVAAVNAAADKYNQTNQAQNSKRSELMKKWNQAVEDFLKKHVN